jgi:hypothetical protein
MPDRTCPDCGVAPGQLHKSSCDVERCPECGGQRLFDDCEERHPRLPWSGEWPGDAECRDLGLWCYWTLNGWVQCEADDPGATEDLPRLIATAAWDAEQGRWVKRQSNA